MADIESIRSLQDAINIDVDKSISQAFNLSSFPLSPAPLISKATETSTGQFQTINNAAAASFGRRNHSTLPIIFKQKDGL